MKPNFKEVVKTQKLDYGYTAIAPRSPNVPVISMSRTDIESDVIASTSS
ncbi:uncharacterized protein ARMOST_00393 [Armillaria ostoyae]|uniref:Uncharacterized protein n=1 Tax=Armillaria ostoyae TaxID=47428 RepID=A0A284QL13_ARMOS|nr:uncharacterized protein ARMOST_00393 [Armillaria ostoyae]